MPRLEFGKHLPVGLIALGLAILMLAVAGPVRAEQDTPRPGTLTLEGVGEISGRPDMAMVSTGVVSEAKTARAALSANTKAMNEVVSWLKSNGIADKDIQTSGFSVQPRYTQPHANSNGERPPPRIVGYTVSNQVTIRVREIDQLGTILDHVVTSGSNRVNGISFAFSNADEMLDQARALAMADAIRKAGIYTGAAKIGLGRITAISEIGGYRPQPQMMRMQARAMESGAPVPVEAGEQTLRMQINVSWELDQ